MSLPDAVPVPAAATVPETAPLAGLLPGRDEPALSADEILNRFVNYVSQQGLELYPAQEEAVLELLGGKHLFLKTPTGSGKSLVAMALHFKAMAEGKRSFYTCPIKALVNEKFFALCQAFGAENVGMVTGDASINRDAPIVVCTAEVLSNLALRDPELRAPYVVMDEFHYYADVERGVAWQVPLLAMPYTTFLLMSATLGDTTDIARRLGEHTGREVAVVQSGHRPVPLDFDYAETPLHETIQTLMNTQRAPIYLVNFTQRAAAEEAQNLLSVDFLSKAEKEQLKEQLQGFRFDTPYGKDFQKFLRHGVGLHHAGLLPKYRLLVEKLAQSGLLKVVSGTDTLGVGVNIPIRTVLFTQLCKFNGEKTGILTAREFHQVAGRAGRKGFDDRGTVVVQAPAHVIENLKLEQKAKGKKVVKKQPPEKGYVHWDRATFDKLLVKTPEPLESRFQITHGMLLSVLQAPELNTRGGYGRLMEIINASHERDYNKRLHRKKAKQAFKSLREAGIISTERFPGRAGARVVVKETLQKEFSLHQTLSLYLLDVLGRLDSQSETYSLDIVTMVESILENPMAVLIKQLDKVKGDKVAELKAKGVEYDDRMAELEKLEWPKPLREFIYDTFNAFARLHPWVDQENIRPKSVAREMLETYLSFHDYVRDYQLQRSEGVLLRYLSEVYKTLAQNIPKASRTEDMTDQLVTLRTMLKQVDSSLIDEWEAMRNPGAAKVEAGTTAVVVPTAGEALIADPRAFAARVRSELGRVVKSLSRMDYESAFAAFRPGAVEVTEKTLVEQMAPFWAEHHTINTTPVARRPVHTTIRLEEPKLWTVTQRMLDNDHDDDWMIEARVDLRDHLPDDGPMIEYVRIGV
jgi:superfamily II RNA helicase